MEKIYFVFDEPVPSCVTNRIIWDEKNKKWQYEFEVKSSTDFNFEKPLFLYGHIQQLNFVDRVTKNSINLQINSIDEIKDLICRQREQDLIYRENWIKEHPDYYNNIFTITVKNETQRLDYDHIISVLKQDDEETTFIVAPQKKKKNKKEEI